MRFFKGLRSHWLKIVLGILPFALYFKLTDTMSWRPRFIEWKAAKFDSYPTVTNLAFIPNGDLVTISEDSQLRYWNPATGELKKTELGDVTMCGTWASPSTFSADGSLIASVACPGGNVAVSDATISYTLSHIVDTQHAQFRDVVALSPRAKLVAVATRISYKTKSDVVNVYEVTQGRRVQSLHTGLEPMVLEFSRDGRFLWIAGSNPNSGSPYYGMGRGSHLKCWDITTGKQTVSRQFVSPINEMKISPDGKILATNGLRGEVILWNLATGQKAQTLTAVRPRAHGDVGMAESVAIAFSPDGNLLASAEGYQAQLWNVRSGKFLRSLIRPEIPQYAGNPGVEAVAFSPDSRTIALAGKGGRNAHLFRVQ